MRQLSSIGDHNLYNSLITGIKRERSNVSLDQVILPDNLKEEIEIRLPSTVLKICVVD
jgi:hypothetical protein